MSRSKNFQFIDVKEWKPGETIELPDFIKKAIRCAPMDRVNIRNWRPLETDELTNAEKAMRLIETKFFVPSGNYVGRPALLMFFQECVLYLLIDCEPRTAMVSLARRNGKTFIQACLILIHLVGFLSEKNMSTGSFALTREQAGILFKQLSDMIQLSPEIEPLVRVVPSSKRVVGLKTGAEYFAGSGEGKSNLGRSLKYLVLDEAGSIKGPDNEYTQALRTSQSSYEHASFIAISTQAASDADYFSVLLDSAEREQPPDTVAILFETPIEYAIDDPEGWVYSNPGIGVFRSYDDMKAQAESAKRINAQEGGFRNLCLNQRTALDGLWLSPSVFKQNTGPVDFDVFRNNDVCIALDLSARNDLTAATIAAKCEETGIVHVFPFVFCPTEGIAERGLRDRAPYQQWCKDGYMIPIGGKSMDYSQISEYLREALQDMGVYPRWVCFDRWGIESFKKFASDEGFCQDAEWLPVGQGFKDFAPRTAAFMTLALEAKIRTGAHPLIAMAFSNAIAVRSPAGDIKLDKSKSTQRIDPAISTVMAVYQVTEGNLTPSFSVDALIG